MQCKIVTSRRSPLARAGVAVLMMGTLAGCHGGAGASATSSAGVRTGSPAVVTTASPTPSAPAVTVVSGVDPGQSTPQAVVAAFVDAYGHNQVPTACRYVVPEEQGTCPEFIGQATLGAVAPVTIGQVSTSGNQAIVAAVGKLCTVQACNLNTDPHVGVPATSAGFSAAYLDAAEGVSYGRPDFACQKIGDLWYVDLNLVTALPSPPH